VLDLSSSTLHRAAAHGDYSVLEAMLNSPDTNVGEVDNKMRTAMHGKRVDVLGGFDWVTGCVRGWVSGVGLSGRVGGWMACARDQQRATKKGKDITR
jgi:hypothetical protein